MDSESFIIIGEDIKSSCKSFSPEEINYIINNDIKTTFYEQVQPTILLWKQAKFEKLLINEHFQFLHFQSAKCNAGDRTNLCIDIMHKVQFQCNISTQHKKKAKVKLSILTKGNFNPRTKIKIFKSTKGVYLYNDEHKKHWTRWKQRYYFYKQDVTTNNTTISKIEGVEWNTSKEGHVIKFIFNANKKISNEYKLKSFYSLLITFFIQGNFGLFKDMAKKIFGWRIDWIVKCGNPSCPVAMIRKRKRYEFINQNQLDQCLYYIKNYNQQVWNESINNTKLKRFKCKCNGNKKRSKFSVCNKRSCAKKCWKRHRNECLGKRDE